MLVLDSSCAPDSGEYCDLKIKKVRVRSVWLCKKGLAVPASFFTGALTLNPVTHWWVEIETVDNKVWFCAQFNKPDLKLTRHSRLSEVTEEGLNEKNNTAHPAITEKAIFQPNATMGDVYTWMQDRCTRYNVIFNNCQDFGDAFSKHFGGVYASNMPIRIDDTLKMIEAMPQFQSSFNAAEGVFREVTNQIDRCTIS